MNRFAQLTLALLLPLALAACDARTEKTDGGGVILSITDFDGLPVRVSVNDPAGSSAALCDEEGVCVIDSITIQNIPKNASAPTSDLMNVELVSYEVTFTRADTGTRVPAPYVRGIFGVVPVGGTLDIDGLPIFDEEQLENVPLSDLLFENGGTDTETGDETILLNWRLRFFGRTLSDDEVETGPADFTTRFTR
jgi:hypothetical protein